MAGDISENNRYFHLVALVVDVCPFVLREYFMKMAKDESAKQGKSFQDIKTFLIQNQGQILSLLKRKKIKQVQFDLISQSGDIEKWDVTLLIALIKGMFNPLPLLVETCLADITTERNYVAHKTLNNQISEDEFHGKWQKLETTIKFMASQVNSESVKKEMQNRIQNIKEVKMKGLVTRVMQQWLNLKVDEMREELEAIKDETKKTNETLDDVTVETGTQGIKRMRTLSTTLEKMQSDFKTFASDLEGKDSSHLSTANVLEHLQTSKKVLISSDSSESGGLLALKAIKDMKTDQSKCCLMILSSEWGHITSDQVEVVVVKDVFGGKEYQPEKAQSMKEIAEHDSDVMIIFLTDHDKFIDFKDEDRGNFPCAVVEIGNAGTEDDPVKLCTTADHATSDPVLRNMIGHTDCFIKHWSDRRVDDRVLEKANKVLKENKAVFIHSRDPEPRRILAVRLLSNFKSNHILLQSPEDLKHIALGQIGIVLIEDFTGKLGFDRQIYDNWYRAFDTLMAGVSDGKMQVITTLDSENMRYLQIMHPIMKDKEVVVESNNIVFKTEHFLSDIQRPSDANNGKIICEDALISSAAFMQDGSLVLCDHLHNQLRLYDKDFNFLAKKKQSDKPFGVCAVTEKNVAVSFPDQKKLSLFQIVPEYKPLRALQLNREPWGIDAHERTIYAICNDTKGKVIIIITLDNDNQPTTRELDTALFGGHIDHYIRVKRGPDCVYLIVTDSEASAVKCLTEHGNVEFQYTSDSLQGAEDLYVDMAGNILVCGRTSNNIYFIHSDGNEGNLLVDGIDKPRCLAYRKSDGALLVGTSSSAVIYYLEVSYDTSI